MKPDLNVGESRAASFRPTGLVYLSYRWSKMKRSTHNYIHQGNRFPHRDCGFRVRHTGRRSGDIPLKSPTAKFYPGHLSGAKRLKNNRSRRPGVTSFSLMADRRKQGSKIRPSTKDIFGVSSSSESAQLKRCIALLVVAYFNNVTKQLSKCGSCQWHKKTEF